ncbi:MAG: EscU/YscU/HrcU family type III secretion system export apparatus switch protein [Deltaproteobacteria bacterium]|nr:EscU/YscU/HrcU family type III secretion system export apparatus switch protein [Deltaproteobacteria bacterium]
MAEGEDSGAERTEDATPQRREKAREEGQVASSPEVAVAVTMIVLTMSLAFVLPGTGQQALDTMVASFEWPKGGVFGLPEVTELLRRAFWAALGLVAPVAGLALLLGVFASIAQVGFHLNIGLLGVDFQRLDPSRWFGRIASAELPLGLLKSLLKGAGVVALAAVALSDEPSQLWRAAFGSTTQLVQHLHHLASEVAGKVTAALVVLAGLDYGWARYQHEERLKMSKQELKEEAKESDGNPQVKAAMRRKMRENQKKKKLVDQVKEATVIAVNPTHYAVALRYWQKVDGSPRVVAKGVDHRAAKIREIAQKHGIPIIEDKPLARTLYALVKEGDAIPVDLYRSVAKLLAIVYRRRTPDGGRR